MAEVKWIKLTTDMFDNRKIKHLRRLPEGNSIVLIWVMLLTMAGRCNASGMIFLTENIPYTPKMLADELDFEENTVVLALRALEDLNMVVTNKGYFTIAGWEEYQNIEGMEKIREQNRIRQKKRREKSKQALIGATNACEYCGKEGATVDHIIPKSKGGLDLPENTVCSCASCNLRKTNRPLEAFLNELIATESGFDIARILANSKIMQYVDFDGKWFVSRDVTVHVTVSHGIDKEEEKEIKNKNKRVEEEKKEKKIRHGEFHNVLLSDTEYSSLIQDFGEDMTAKAIKFLDEYIEEKGYKSKSHNLAIRRWVIDAIKEREKAPPQTKPNGNQANGNPFLALIDSEGDDL